MPVKSESNQGELTRKEIRILTLDDQERQRQNQFARNHPRLAEALDRLDKNDRKNTREDLQQISRILLGRVIAAAMAAPDELDPEKAKELLLFVGGEEMRQAKIDKLKADVESVTQNVATPTAMRKLFNDFALCIQRGNEIAVSMMLEEAKTPEERDLIMRVGGNVFQQVSDEIQRFGREDTSMARILAAMD